MPVSEDATVTSKGQVTIPKRIRDQIGLTPGTELEFVLEADGTIRVRPKRPPLERLRGVKERLADYEIDVETLRQDSKTAWGTHLDEEDA